MGKAVSNNGLENWKRVCMILKQHPI